MNDTIEISILNQRQRNELKALIKQPTHSTDNIKVIHPRRPGQKGCKTRKVPTNFDLCTVVDKGHGDALPILSCVTTILGNLSRRTLQGQREQAYQPCTSQSGISKVMRTSITISSLTRMVILSSARTANPILEAEPTTGQCQLGMHPRQQDQREVLPMEYDPP